MTTEQVTPEEQVAKPIEDKPPVTVEELQKQLTELQGTSQKNEDNWKNEVRVKTKKDQEIQRLREQLSSNESQSSINKALIAMMASQKNQPTEELTEEIKEKQPDLLKQYEQIEQAAEKKRTLDRAVNRIKAVQERAEGIGLQGEDYDIVRAFAEAGQFDKAEKKLVKLEEAKQTKPLEPKETEDEKVERLAEAKYKAKLEEKGLLTQDAGTPSGSGGKLTAKMVEAMNPAERFARADEIAKIPMGYDSLAK